MKFIKSAWLLLSTSFFITTCGGDGYPDDIKICPQNCPDGSPWQIETLDLGLPCFVTEKECLEWAETHGYSGSSCVKCD